jgi:hypothetical protein
LFTRFLGHRPLSTLAASCPTLFRSRLKAASEKEAVWGRVTTLLEDVKTGSGNPPGLEGRDQC